MSMEEPSFNHHQSDESLGQMELHSTTQLQASQDDFLKPCGGAVGAWAVKIRSLAVQGHYLKEQTVSWIMSSIILALTLAYAIYVSVRWFYSDCEDIGWRDGYGLFLIIILLVTVFKIQPYISSHLIDWVMTDSLRKITKKVKALSRCGFYWILGGCVLVCLVLSLIDASQEPRRYISLGGYFLILFIAFLFSKHPDYIRWDTVARGVGIHMLLAFVLVKWSPGRVALSLFSEKVIDFLEFSYMGARFVYGDFLIDAGVFLFKSLSVVFFLGMIINVLFYYGVVQSVMRRMGQLMQFLLGTTIIESSNSVASTFLGMSESPILFKPYIGELTSSELHAVMSSGFATVAGTVLAAYVSFGADPVMLVTASAMAAPASLTLAKLFFPETQLTKTSTDNFVIYKSKDGNAVDAACKGAMLGCELVPAIAANVLSFIALIAFLNAVLGWMGRLAGVPDISFEELVGLVFIPLSWAMGVEPSEIGYVARLIGIKTAVNEFVGYKQLGLLKEAKKLSVRSEAIATYAMCGFANPASVAIFVSSLVTVCPEKSLVITEVALRAFVSGSFASFLSASLTGFLTPELGFHSENWASSPNDLPQDSNHSCYYYSW